MKAGILATVLISFLCLFVAPDAFARGGGSKSSGSRSSSRGKDVHVNGYFRKDGTYVQPHYRSAADGNFQNNWSTAGNVNPYTRVPGTKIAPPATYGKDVWVNGHYRADGTYVGGHWRSAPDGDPTNNWSTAGNVNPYTGAVGTRALPSSFAVGALYAVSDHPSGVDIPLESLRNERDEYPKYFKIGKSGRHYYFWDSDGGYWSSPMQGEWPRTVGSAEMEPWDIQAKLLESMKHTSWTTEANRAMDERRYGAGLAIVEAHASECTPEVLAKVHADVAERWDASVQAIRGLWSGAAERAYEQALKLAKEFEGTSLSKRTAEWVRAMRDLLHPATAAAAGG